MQTEQRIRNWLMSFPGLVVAHSPQAVLREALTLFKSQTGTECPPVAFEGWQSTVLANKAFRRTVQLSRRNARFDHRHQKL